jgi:predicted RNA-binding Zn-ribbon protein involved in translation (DUF1610 family)
MTYHQDSVLSALVAKGVVEGDCPACGCERPWRSPDQTGFLVHGESEHPHDEALTLVICQNCGFTRIFHLPTLLARD